MRTVKKPWDEKPVKTLTKEELRQAEIAKRKKEIESIQPAAPWEPHVNPEGRPRWKYNKELGRELPMQRGEEERNGPIYPPLKAEEIIGAHKGKLIFVLGCGPSLLEAEQYKETIESMHISVGVNQSYLLFESQYIIFLDKHSWKFDKERLCSMRTHIFTSINTKAPGVNSFVQYIPPGGGPFLTEHIDHGLFGTRSSIYPAINLAYLLGASAIALLGVDLYSNSHFWSLTTEFQNNPVLRDRKKFWQSKAANPNYPGGTKIAQTINKLGTYMKNRGVKLFNCSAKSRVSGDIWEKIPVEQLLALYQSHEVAASAPALESAPAPQFEEEQEHRRL